MGEPRRSFLARVAPELVRLAEAEPEREVCGFIVAAEDGGLEVLPVPNVAGDAHARTRFELDPAAHLALSRRLRLEGRRPVALYHSHVEGGADLSPVDRERMVLDGVPVLPGVDPVVIAMRSGKAEEVRMFTWNTRIYSLREAWTPIPGGEVESGVPGAKSKAT